MNIIASKKLRITLSTKRGMVTFYLKGHFCFRAYAKFKKIYMNQLSNSTIGCIVINLSEVNYLDSSAMGQLLELRQFARDENKCLVLSSPTPHIERKLGYANFYRIFNIDPPGLRVNECPPC